MEVECNYIHLYDPEPLRACTVLLENSECCNRTVASSPCGFVGSTKSYIIFYIGSKFVLAGAVLFVC
jgi:hypothetical protein